jgi:hypothetical protein
MNALPTVGIKAHNPLSFCVRCAFHVRLVNVFSGLGIRAEIEKWIQSTGHLNEDGWPYVMLATAKANSVPSSSTLPAKVQCEQFVNPPPETPYR